MVSPDPSQREGPAFECRMFNGLLSGLYCYVFNLSHFTESDGRVDALVHHRSKAQMGVRTALHQDTHCCLAPKHESARVITKMQQPSIQVPTYDEVCTVIMHHPD